MVPRTRALTFGDDHSSGADAAWSWISSHPWPQWSVEVVTVTIPTGRAVDSPLGHTNLQPWDPPMPRRAPGSCRFESVTHLAAENDPRVILGGRSGSDLVVVGPRGQGLLKELRLGSTAEWLMRCPSAPLIIARRPVTTRSIMVCVDGSHHAAAAVECLASMPWVAGTSVTVLGVAQWSDDLTIAVEDAAGKLRAAGANSTPLVVEPDRLSITISPHLTIFQHLDDRAPDLVVLGTSGRTGLARLWVGSVASAVARHARCSVLLVRDARGDADDGGR
jgi:nucleotide-binding universal stress UspA family protein